MNGTGKRWPGLAVSVVLALTGCASIGPATVPADRFNYTAALADSWKTQMLLNLVKLRYADTPVFLDIGQVVSAYTLGGTLAATATLPFDGLYRGSAGLAAGGSFSQTPTISYTPLTGEKFARAMMMPVPVAAILSVVQAGYPVDTVFRLAVQSINGIDNRRVYPLYSQQAEPEFYVLLPLLRRIQVSGDMGMTVRRAEKDKELEVSLVVRTNLPAAVERARHRVATLLGVDPTAKEYRVVHGAEPANDKEIAILSRSILEILTDISSGISVPETHVRERRVSATPEADFGPEEPIPSLIRIESSVDRPADAFVAVPFRDHWFYIDDRDIPSKRLFSFLMFLFTFVEPGTSGNLPVLTISTGSGR